MEVYRRHVFFLSASRLISITGSIAAYVALVAVIYDRSNHSGTWVAAGLVVSFGVSALLGPWAGQLGDRYDRRRVMIAAELTAAAAFVGIAFAHSLVLLIVLAGVATAAESPFGPAAQALLVNLVPEEQRTWATATRSSSASAGMFVGGAIGGFVVAAFGGATAFLINAASFVISAAFVSAIKGRYRPVRSEGVVDRGTSEGFRFVFSAPALWLTLVATSVGLLGTGMINVAEYPLFVDMGGGSQAYGIAVAGWAVGGFVAGRTMRKHGDAYTERTRLLFGCGLVAVPIGLCGVVPLVGAVVVLFSIGGVRCADARHRSHADLPALDARPHSRSHLCRTRDRQHVGDRRRDDRQRRRHGNADSGRGLHRLRIRGAPRALHRDPCAATSP
jgi:MFS family permease